MDALFYADNPGKNIVEGREGCVRVLRVTLAQITGIGGIIGIDAGVIALEHDIALSAFELGNDGVHSLLCARSDELLVQIDDFDPPFDKARGSIRSVYAPGRAGGIQMEPWESGNLLYNGDRDGAFCR